MIKPSFKCEIAIFVGVILVLISGSLHAAHAGATITVINLDNPGEGFNSYAAPDQNSKTGSNTGVTLGQQRLIAFQYAADIWGNILNSNVGIKVGANFNPLSCNSTSAVLGSAGPNSAHRNFSGAPESNTWYVQALANSLADTDLSPDNDINAEFNSAIGTTCSFPRVWYYGLDGNPPGNSIDFVSVVLHELAHGLGFLTFVDIVNGNKFLGYNDAFMSYLENHSTGKLYPEMTNGERVLASTDTGDLHWIGSRVVAASSTLSTGRHPSGHVEMYAPPFPQYGSSVSHFSTSLFPNQLMEPSYTGPSHDLELTLSLLEDIGWLSNLACRLPKGHVDYCKDSNCGPCVVGEGDCDGDSQCQAGLICAQDVGAIYGMPENYDVCEQPPGGPCDVFQPGPNWCRDCGPCAEGEGDCDGDNECQNGLVCAQDVGANYGWPTSRDVCEQPGGPGDCILGNRFELGSIKVTEFLYTDRAYTITGGVPSWMVGRTLIRTPNNERNNNTGSGYIRFTTPVSYWVYVLFDSRSSSIPNWLSSWERRSAYQILTSLGSQPYLKVYRKWFDAGQCVDLGGNYGPGSSGETRSNYVVVFGQ